MIDKEEFNNKGYTILKDILSPSVVTLLKKKLDKIQQIQITEFGLDKIKTINEQE